MKLFAAIFLMFVFTACNKTHTALKEQIVNSDSVAINFFKGDGTMDTVVAVRIIRDKILINQLADLITEKKIDIKTNCGFDGSLHFFKMNQVIQDVNFVIQDKGCSQFSFKLITDNHWEATGLSYVAKTLLLDFKNHP